MLTDSELMRAAAYPGLSFVCVCNHEEGAHSMTGYCRVPGCLCEHYQPMPEVAPGGLTPWHCIHLDADRRVGESGAPQKEPTIAAPSMSSRPQISGTSVVGSAARSVH